jgi:hypothetical protein
MTWLEQVYFWLDIFCTFVNKFMQMLHAQNVRCRRLKIAFCYNKIFKVFFVEKWKYIVYILNNIKISKSGQITIQFKISYYTPDPNFKFVCQKNNNKKIDEIVSKVGQLVSILNSVSEITPLVQIQSLYVKKVGQMISNYLKKVSWFQSSIC